MNSRIVPRSVELGGKHCDSCQSTRFWTDATGLENCETCNPPIVEAYVVSRIDYAAPADPVTGPAVESPKREYRPSIFTEGQWNAAGQRLLRKIAERAERAAPRKETQCLTPDQEATIAWARQSLTTGTLPTDPVSLARYHCLPDPTQFVRLTLAHLDRHLPSRPPDFSQSVERLELLRTSLIIKGS